MSVLRTEVLVVTAGGDHPAGGMLVTHPEVREPWLDTARRGHSVQAMCNIYTTTSGLYILPSAALEVRGIFFREEYGRRKSIHQ